MYATWNKKAKVRVFQHVVSNHPMLRNLEDPNLSKWKISLYDVKVFMGQFSGLKFHNIASSKIWTPIDYPQINKLYNFVHLLNVKQDFYLKFV